MTVASAVSWSANVSVTEDSASDCVFVIASNDKWMTDNSLDNPKHQHASKKSLETKSVLNVAKKRRYDK